jgi:hypothetical protein
LGSFYRNSKKINATYPDISTTPASLLTVRLPLIIGIKAREKRSMIGNSKKRVSLGTFNGLTNATDPKTRSILKILLPITFPTQISVSFLRTLTTDVAISGTEVPKATTVIPMTISLIPKLPAIKIADLTNTCEPTKRHAKPITI